MVGNVDRPTAAFLLLDHQNCLQIIFAGFMDRHRDQLLIIFPSGGAGEGFFPVIIFSIISNSPAVEKGDFGFF
jgi:hypothetical protein